MQMQKNEKINANACKDKMNKMKEMKKQKEMNANTKKTK